MGEPYQSEGRSASETLRDGAESVYIYCAARVVVETKRVGD